MPSASVSYGRLADEIGMSCKLLNQALPSCRPVRTWFLKIVSVWVSVWVCVCLCVQGVSYAKTPSV